MLQPSELVIKDGSVYHLGLQKGQLAPHVFLVGDPARAYKVADRFERIDVEVKNREYVTLTGVYQNQPVSVIGTGMGTDNIEIMLVEAYYLREFDFQSFLRLPDIPPLKLIRIGTSGGVQSDIPAGTMGISSYALGLDNVGLFYDSPPVDQWVNMLEQTAYDLLNKVAIPNARFSRKIQPYVSKSSNEVFDALSLAAKNQEASYVQGITATTPGFYGPSGRFIDGLSNTFPFIKKQLAKLEVDGHRVINMEMESSLLFHIATHLGYQAGTICAIISSPDTSADIVDYQACVSQAIDIAMEAMISLERQ